MTSEGHYAGSQPAEATSGGPGPDGFPSDADGQRVSGRASAPAPADGFPSSYGPPPQATPNGGSPFVVPAVPTFGQGPDGPRPATGTSYGSARVPASDESGGLPQRNPAPSADDGGALPQRGAASPYGSVSPSDAGGYGATSASPFGPAQGGGPSSVFGSPPSDSSREAAPASAEPKSVWGSPPATPGRSSLGQAFIQRPGAPLPQRNAPTGNPIGGVEGFDGFAAAATRGAAEPEQVDPSTSRPPGVSAFGAQPVRVPGATLTGLPDVPSQPNRSGDVSAQPGDNGGTDNGFGARPGDNGGFPAQLGDNGFAAPSGFTPQPNDNDLASQSGDSGGFPLRSGGGSAFPTRRGDSGGFPLRGTPDDLEQPGHPASTFEGSLAQPAATPSAELPVRSQQAPFGAPASYPADATPAAAEGFSAFGGTADEIPPHPYGRPEPFADPFGRSTTEGGPSSEAQSAGPAPGGFERDGLPDPFGRTGEPAGQQAQAGAAYGTARPFSPTDEGSSDSAFGARPAGPVYGSARPAAPESGAQVYGSARPAGPYGQPEGDSGAFGSARPTSPYGAGHDDSPAAPRAASPTYGSARPVSPFDDGQQNDGQQNDAEGSSFGARPAAESSPFGSRPDAESSPYGARSDAESSPFGARPDAANSPFGHRPGAAAESGDEQSSSPFGVVREPGAAYGAARPASPFAADNDDQADDHAMFRRPGQSEDNPNGYPQRVPGAALGALSSAASADSRSSSVPAPRDPAENPAAVGSARPITASASVPSASRTAPVEATELPLPAAAPQARVYGRPAPADDESKARDDDQDSGAFSADSPFARPDDDRAAPPPSAFGSPAFSGDPNGPGGEPGVAPQSPARASASARVTPAGALGGPGGPPTGMSSALALPGAAPEPAPPGSPYSDRPALPPGRPGEPYSEPTTDIAGRDQQPYVPAPALPPMPPGLNGFDPAGRPGSNGFDPADRPGSNGFGPSGPHSSNGFGVPDSDPFLSPASRATVTPPTPEETTSWPGIEADQGRFDNFKAEAAKAAPAKPETPHVRILPILLAVVVGALLLLGIVFGIVYLVAGGNSNDSLSVIQGECVKQDGEKALKADCSDASSFQVVSIVDDKAQCADPQQPVVINKTADGKDQVLCLKPNA